MPCGARTRGIGWEFVHVCIDDCSRVAYAEVLPDERAVTVAGFLRRSLTWFARRRVVVQRILTDNGSAYRSHRLAALCRARRLGLHPFDYVVTRRSTNGRKPAGRPAATDPRSKPPLIRVAVAPRGQRTRSPPAPPLAHRAG